MFCARRFIHVPKQEPCLEIRSLFSLTYRERRALLERPMSMARCPSSGHLIIAIVMQASFQRLENSGIPFAQSGQVQVRRCPLAEVLLVKPIIAFSVAAGCFCWTCATHAGPGHTESLLRIPAP